MNKIIPLLLATVVGLGIFLSSLFLVDQRQYAVVYTLGEIREVIDEPGLHLKWPPPFQNVVYYDKRILTLDTAEIDRFITSEKLNLQVDSFIKWQIIEPKAFIRSVQGVFAMRLITKSPSAPWPRLFRVSVTSWLKIFAPRSTRTRVRSACKSLTWD
jgi:regulator of protease activity HflC (stomatin/prohibitin superfamily)